MIEIFEELFPDKPSFFLTQSVHHANTWTAIFTLFVSKNARGVATSQTVIQHQWAITSRGWNSLRHFYSSSALTCQFDRNQRTLTRIGTDDWVGCSQDSWRCHCYTSCIEISYASQGRPFRATFQLGAIIPDKCQLHNTSSPTGGIQDDWQFPHEPFDAQTATMFPQELPVSNRRQELISGTLIHMQKRTHRSTTWQAHCRWWHFCGWTSCTKWRTSSRRETEIEIYLYP